jgi:nucleoside phosphorylase
MFFSGSARLSEQLPELGDLPARLDELLRDVGAGDLLEPEALASELVVSPEQLARVLAAASQPPVDLLVAERYVVCPRCRMLNPAEEREVAIAVGDEYACSDCDLDLAAAEVKPVSRYRLAPGALAEAEERRAAERARPKKTAVILTALAVEQAAVLAHLVDLHDVVHEAGTVYRVGTFASPTTDWTVATALIGAGNAGAAFEAERAVRHFDPEVRLFVGVAGGIKDVALGDVVAATDVFGYHSGKAGDTFTARPDVGKSTYALVQRAQAEAQSGEWLTRRLDGGGEPSVAVAPIAAGEQVVASTRSETYEFIRAHYDRAVAVEMEGRGFLAALHANQKVGALVVRGISDLLDAKDVSDEEGWQERASANAAAFAFEVLGKL